MRIRRIGVSGGSSKSPVRRGEQVISRNLSEILEAPLTFPDMDAWEKGLTFEGLRNKEKDGPEVIAAVRANLDAMRNRISAGGKPPHVESIPPTRDEETALLEAEKLLVETRSRLQLPTIN